MELALDKGSWGGVMVNMCKVNTPCIDPGVSITFQPHNSSQFLLLVLYVLNLYTSLLIIKRPYTMSMYR